MKYIDLRNNVNNTYYSIKNTTSSIKDKILEEIERRYGFNTPNLEIPKYGILHFAPYVYYKPTIDTDNLRYGIIKPKYHLISTLDDAMNKLREYAKKVKLERILNSELNEDKDYDFIYYGEPVKFYDNFIQIGSRIIPTVHYNKYFNSITEEEKHAKIINLIINISNYVAA